MQLRISNLEKAVKDLSPSAFKLYLYFAANQDNYLFNYSPKDFQNRYDVSESTAKRAKQELIEKGYIVQKGNNFDFYADKEDSQLSLEELKKMINSTAKTLVMNGIERSEIEKIIKPITQIPDDQEKEKKKVIKEILLKMQSMGKEIIDDFIS